MLKRLLRGQNLLGMQTRSGLNFSTGPGLQAIRIYREIFIEKVYNPVGFEINKGDVVLDIGANIGIYTVFAASQGCKIVHAFEPHPITYSILLQNIKLNDLKHVEAHQVGIASEEANGILEASDVSGHHRVVEMQGLHPSTSGIEIQTINLNEFFEKTNLESIDFIKMDCEGSEGEILSSLDHRSFQKIQKIVIEYHNNISQLDDEEIVKLLKKNGFYCIKTPSKNSCGYIYARKI